MSSLEKARQQLEQAKARYNALVAKQSAEERKRDTRRKIILGAMLIDAAKHKNPEEAESAGKVIDLLISRVSREHDLKAFQGWTRPGREQP